MLPIHQISMPTPWPATGPVHAYLVREDPITLIDTGLNLPESRAALVDGLAALGLTVRDIKRVLVTHAHLDHIGQAAWVAAESGAEVFLHPDEAGKATAPEWWQEGRDRILRAAGVDSQSFDVIQRFWRANRLTALPLTTWSPLADGQRIPFESGELEAMHLPGHALGHTGFYEAASRTLLGGDHLLEGVTPNPILEPVRPGHPDAVPHDPVRALTLDQFLRALERVSTLDAARVLPGHGPIITDHRAVAALYMGKHQRRLERFVDRLGEGRVPWELTREVYPRVQGFDLFLALSEVLAHLDMLVVRGLARFEQGVECRYLPA